MALLYGNGCMEKTLTIAVNSGWDVDCTCASVAALIGIITGRKGINEKLLEKMGDRVLTVSRVANKMDNIADLSDYTCSVGVAIIGERLSDVEISDLPENLRHIPSIEYLQEIEFFVDYNGVPAIGYMESKEMIVGIMNNSKNRKSGLLNLILPEGWVTDIVDTPITLAANEKMEIRCTITVLEDIEQISDTNRLMIIFAENEETSWSHSFGLCGAPKCKVLGPFFDTYKDWNDEKVLPESRFLETPTFKTFLPNSGEEWCNHRIDIDKEYLGEEFSKIEGVREIFKNGEHTSIYGDIYRISNVFGHQGPSCCYYLQEVYSPEDRMVSLVTGSSDPYKVWLNGELIYTQRENRFWLPINNPVAVKMKKGINYVILKVVRTGAENTLTLMFRKHLEEVNPGHDVLPILSDLSYRILK